MARAFNIHSKTGRLALPARREPYWSRVQVGLFVGYRKLAEGEGTWIARHQVGTSKQYQTLGTFTDPKAYDAAAAAARAWLVRLERGVSSAPLTVAQACRHYVAHLATTRSRASARDAQGRFARLVDDARIGQIQVAKLKTTDLKDWLAAQIDLEDDEEEIRRRKDTANRNLASLKAALNLALRDRLVDTDAGWKTVTPFRKVGSRRQHCLSRVERQTLLQCCPADLRHLLVALLLTGARPGEIAHLSVADFDRQLGTMRMRGKTGARVVSLSTAAITFFSEQCRDKLGHAPILTRADGGRWDKDAWKKPFRAAVAADGLPADVVVYTLRHTAISEMIAEGIDTFIVAKLAGTSTAMIDRHYGHLRHDATRARLDRVEMI